MNLANRVTLIRIILVPFFVAAILYRQFTAAFVIFVICIATDALDGYIARIRNERTKLGMLLDPVADKTLLISAFVSLSMIEGLPANLKFPAYVPLVVVSRDIFIIMGCIMIYLFKGHLDIRPTALGKITTFLQMLSILCILAHCGYAVIFWNIAVLATILSGVDYLRIGSKILNEAH